MSFQIRAVNNVVSGAWTNPNNAFVSDGVCTSTSTKDAQNVYNFINNPFSLPSGATINGIIVKTKRAGDADDYYTIELQDKVPAWKLKTGMKYQNTCAGSITEFIGSSLDAWGGTWDAEHINSANFQVRLTFKATGKANPFYVDYIEVTVYYTEVAVGWKQLQYFSEPPSSGAFNKLKFASEPPVSGAWNKLLYEGE